MSILVLTSDTLIGTPATGNLEYNGQFFGTDSNASRAQMQRITQGTAVASTSGTSIDFTGLPAWVKKITVMFQGVSTNGTSELRIRLGTSSGFVSTGYVSRCSQMDTTPGIGVTDATDGFAIRSNNAAATVNGIMLIANISGNIFVSSYSGSHSSTQIASGGGSVTLSGTLDRVRITTVNGTDTFDAGSINILYEG